MDKRLWIAAWAVLGVAATFVEAVVRLLGRAHAEIERGLSPTQWVILAVATVGMTYLEGHRALRRRFVPSVIARSFEVARRDRSRWAPLAPLYALCLVGAPPWTVARSLLGIAAIVACVFIVRALPSPWRGIVDGAVGVALTWGGVALLVDFASALSDITAAQRRRRVQERLTTTRTGEAR